MAIITVNDQIVVIRSHLTSIERAMKNGNTSALPTFFEAIAKAAMEANEYTAALSELQGEDHGNAPSR